MIFSVLLILLLLLVPLLTLRLLYILPHSRLGQRKPVSRKSGSPVHLLIVLGSGGHTAEMLSLIRDLDVSKYQHRTYVISSGDDFSAGLARSFEHKLHEKSAAQQSPTGTFAVVTVPRARKIHQSIFTAPFSSLYCLSYCLKLLKFGLSGSQNQPTPSKASLANRPVTPDLILTNGPATGVIVVFASLILQFFFFLPPGTFSATTTAGNKTPSPQGTSVTRTIYVESWARVRRLSLSGKLLLWIVDRFIVQWERLLPATKGRGEYLGVLVE